MITTTNRPSLSCFLLKDGCWTMLSFPCPWAWLSSKSSLISSTKPSPDMSPPFFLARRLLSAASDSLAAPPRPRALLAATRHSTSATATDGAVAWCILSCVLAARRNGNTAFFALRGHHPPTACSCVLSDVVVSLCIIYEVVRKDKEQE